MHVNILADFTENGMDRNEPHIVCGTNNVYLAAQVVKDKLEKQGCKVQTLFVIEGTWTLEQLYDMANYGDGLEKVQVRPVYMSEEALLFMEELKNNPAMSKKLQQELKRRKEIRKQKPS